jgi:hypothetical protein
MTAAQDRIQLIIEHERNFAELLALKVFKKPEVNLWVILIPIFFVFYLNDLKKYKDGRQAFVSNYLKSRQCALQAAAKGLDGGRKPDLEAVAAKENLPPDGQRKFAELLALLVEHYTILIRAAGTEFQGILLGAYGGYETYAAFLKRLNAAEHALNLALKPQLEESVEDLDDVIESIESYSAAIRRDEAEKFLNS